MDGVSMVGGGIPPLVVIGPANGKGPVYDQGRSADIIGGGGRTASKRGTYFSPELNRLVSYWAHLRVLELIQPLTWRAHGPACICAMVCSSQQRLRMCHTGTTVGVADVVDSQ